MLVGHGEKPSRRATTATVPGVIILLSYLTALSLLCSSVQFWASFSELEKLFPVLADLDPDRFDTRHARTHVPGILQYCQYTAEVEQ